MKIRLFPPFLLTLAFLSGCQAPSGSGQVDDDTSADDDDDDDDGDDDDDDDDSDATSEGQGGDDDDDSTSASDDDDDDDGDDDDDDGETTSTGGSDSQSSSTDDDDDDSSDSTTSSSDLPGDEDADGDGLTNDKEKELGTDPNEVDTDQDTYWDSWEVTEGTDPLDKESRIYIGNWPYNPNKDDLESVDLANGKAQDGSPYVRHKLLDHFGDMVDLYDFSQPGKPMGIDISAVWCGPCNSLAEYLTTGNSEWNYPSLQENVHAGEIRWITILFEDSSQQPPSQNVLSAWAERYPDEKTPILADDRKQLSQIYASNVGYPTVTAVSKDMVITKQPPNRDNWLKGVEYLDGL